MGAAMPDVKTVNSYCWNVDGHNHEFSMVWVPGSGVETYLFGREPRQKAINIGGFFIGGTPVTQSLWTHVMGTNPAVKRAPRCPVENISWDDITRSGGFLARLNERVLGAMVRRRAAPPIPTAF